MLCRSPTAPWAVIWHHQTFIAPNSIATSINANNHQMMQINKLWSLCELKKFVVKRVALTVIECISFIMDGDCSNAQCCRSLDLDCLFLQSLSRERCQQNLFASFQIHANAVTAVQNNEYSFNVIRFDAWRLKNRAQMRVVRDRQSATRRRAGFCQPYHLILGGSLPIQME